MRFNIIFLSLIGIVFNAHAQNFTVGTTWNYNTQQWTTPVQETATIFENMGDTIFNGETLQYISGSGSCWAKEDILIKSIGDKVYILNDCDSTFSLLYDFGAQVGDQFVIYDGTCNFPNDNIEIKIDSIDVITINSIPLKKFYFHRVNDMNQFDFSGDIIEGIGSTSTLIPAISVCDPWTYNLRCFDHPTFGHFNNGLYSNCDTIVTHPIDNIEDKFSKNLVKIYPNPVLNELKITSDLSITSVQILSVSGKIIHTYHIDSLFEINLDLNIQPGIYLAHITTEGGTSIQQIVKY